jgi:two-component system, OmpR family, phosphate regulon sensor histidine kinase PhoR
MTTNSGTQAAALEKTISSLQKSRRLTIFAVLFISFLVVIGISTAIAGVYTQHVWVSALREEITRSLTQKAQMLANRVNTDHSTNIQDIASQEGQAAGARATVVDTNEKVVADSEIPLRSLEDEGHLPEFVAALQGRTGIQTRSRNGADVLFVAVPVSGGAVRLAYPLADLDIASEKARNRLLIGSIIAAMAALLLSALAGVISRASPPL